MGVSENLYIIIPAYNEQDNISECVREWYPVVEAHNNTGGSRLVVVNDGSKDHTMDKLLELSSELPLLIPLSKPNGGHGPAILYGYRYAIWSGADWIFQTDSDRQTDPGEFEGFWRLGKKHDAIIGRRPVRGDGIGRKLVENILCLILKLIFGVIIPDANAPFRLMRSSLVARHIKRLPKNYAVPNIMLTVFFVLFKENVVFRAISFKPRAGGKSSISPEKLIKIGINETLNFITFRKRLLRTARQ